ncbi:hypothetical protein LMH87_006164 [Akanthomyces muscarius]|uniref:Uncharacterized protein n=1 Tax=Akanthomyces muscarius TaxID=2231603 RepID=A0A9W8QM71_AKAMU|nr:hypothetical protein LMH87_006164 [Akanthomyces muscarius]KAJ4164491.1 hypothetical protein LMH87_006164 [Akanthomyces muscarius]
MQIAFFTWTPWNMPTVSGVHRREVTCRRKPERVAEWQARVSRAIYRSLVLSASLVGSYTRPFFETDTAADAPGTCDEPVLEFFRKFAVYDLLSSPSSEGAVFRRAGAWLLEGILFETKERADFEDRFGRGFGWGELCTLDKCPLSFPSLSALWKCLVSARTWLCGNWRKSSRLCVNKADGDKQIRELIVLFNSFEEGYAYFPKTLKWTEKPAITACAAPEPGTGWGKLRSPYGRSAETLETLNYRHRNMMDNPELEDICPPPLGVKWFEHCLWHYLKLGFAPDAFAFASRTELQQYAQFFHSSTLFAADDLEGRHMANPDRWPI